MSPAMTIGHVASMEMAEPVEEHVACVNAWLDRQTALPAPRLLDVFQRAFDSLWSRAHRSLGDVTLSAIVDRVLSTASEAFPLLGPVQIEPARPLFRDLRARASRLRRTELVEAIRFVLVEFLTVLGNLTAEILTPVLHAVLSDPARPKAPAEPGRPRPTNFVRRAQHKRPRRP